VPVEEEGEAMIWFRKKYVFYVWASRFRPGYLKSLLVLAADEKEALSVAHDHADEWREEGLYLSRERNQVCHRLCRGRGESRVLVGTFMPESYHLEFKQDPDVFEGKTEA